MHIIMAWFGMGDLSSMQDSFQDRLLSLNCLLSKITLFDMPAIVLQTQGFSVAVCQCCTHLLQSSIVIKQGPLLKLRFDWQNQYSNRHDHSIHICSPFIDRAIIAAIMVSSLFRSFYCPSIPSFHNDNRADQFSRHLARSASGSCAPTIIAAWTMRIA